MVGIRSRGTRVRVNFGRNAEGAEQPFKFNPSAMRSDTSNEG